MNKERTFQKTDELHKKLAEIPNADLIMLAESYVCNIASFGDKAIRMCVPPQISDTDMILMELITRYKRITEYSL